MQLSNGPRRGECAPPPSPPKGDNVKQQVVLHVDANKTGYIPSAVPPVAVPSSVCSPVPLALHSPQIETGGVGRIPWSGRGDGNV